MLTNFKQFSKNRSHYKEDFMFIIHELLQEDLVKKLDTRMQHLKFTRLRHSFDVSYYSYFLARFFNCDYVSAARAGLLHDLFFHEGEQTNYELLHSHPKVALENASRICNLNPIEKNAILGHMWPFTNYRLKHKEGYIVSLSDKICAIREVFISIFSNKTVFRFDSAYMPLPVKIPITVK